MSPCVALTVASPQQAAGMRPLPPWSTPRAASTAPEPTADPAPPDDPPAVREGSRGFRAGPKALITPVAPPPWSSMLRVPAIDPPACRIRSTTTESNVGTKGGKTDPLVIGTPATAMLSFTPNRQPARGPSSAPRTSHTRMKALWGSSSAEGRRPGSREVSKVGMSGCSKRSASAAAITRAVTMPESSPASPPASSIPSWAAVSSRSAMEGGRTVRRLRSIRFISSPKLLGPPTSV